MANVNKVTLIGKLTRDIELRHTKNGTEVCEMCLAINHYKKSENGEATNEATFIDVTLWKNNAVNAHKYLQKGDEVYVGGYLKIDKWIDEETGKSRQKLHVIGDNLQFISTSKNKNNE